MVTAVTLNPCIDRTVWLEKLEQGAHNRAISTHCDISGKGINVNIVLQHLGIDTSCLSLLHSDGGDAVKGLMDSLGIPFMGVEVPGSLRINLKLTETGNGRMTEINESGSAVDEHTTQRVMRGLDELLPQTDILVASGSVPPGVPDDIYAAMVERARGHSVRTLLDCADVLLRKGLAPKPWAVKPNKYELERLSGCSIGSLEQAASMCRELNSAGVELVCLSLGKHGAMLTAENETWFSAGLDIEVKGVQGAGDSMVAGLCAAAMGGLGLPDMLRYGVAAAHASLLREGTLLCERDCFEELLEKITVEKIL